MRIVGVIAEYNPFHLGHAHHLAEAKRLANADAVVAVTSTAFTQRGDAAILSPAARARMALANGADAVFALPCQWCVRDAERFALGGVALLNGLGCDAISFGSEVTGAEQLRRTAEALEHPDEAQQSAIQAHLKRGLPWPEAVSAALDAPLLSTPNSTLAVCYLRAMIRLNSAMDVAVAPRIGSYHATDFSGGLPSATAVRAAMLSGDWAKVQSALPESAWAILRHEAVNGRIHRPDALDAALAYRLRTMSDAEFSALPDVSEGVEHRLKSAAHAEATREGILQRAKTRRYPYARLSRLATHALLQLTNDAAPKDAIPDAAWLLGFRADRRDVLREIKGRASLPVFSKAADLRGASSWFALEERAWNLWALGAGLPSGLAVTQGVVRV